MTTAVGQGDSGPLCRAVAASFTRRAYACLARLRRGWLDDRGTVTIELVLVIPVVLFFSLLLVQVMLLMTANHFVHYAAYAAVRSAIVQIPVDATGRDGTRRLWNWTYAELDIATEKNE